MKIIDGNKIGDEVLDELKKEISGIKTKLNLGIVIVGKDPVSLSFIKKKEEAARRLGIGFKLWQFPEAISNRALRRQLSQISARKNIQGIIIQLPLPAHLNSQYILDSIPLDKDIDVLSSCSSGKFYTGKSKILPPVVEAVLKVFENCDIKVKSQSIVIIGAGRLIGKPLTIALLARGATVSVLNEFTPSIERYTLNADIIISGAGKKGALKASMIKKGAVVIDGGMNAEVSQSKILIKGDVDTHGLEKKASILVPARGGLGPITVAMVIKNLVKKTLN